MTGSLEGITIIDLTQGIAGPVTTLVMAEQGADVIKVEPPGGDPWRQVEPGYLVWDRAKRSVTLDLEKRAGIDALLRLLATADVLVESFPPGETARLGIDHASLKDRFPQLIHCSISGYGYDHPWKDRSAREGLVSSRMGIPWGQVGNRPGPIFHYFPVASYGTVFAASMGIASALRARLHTGRGQWVETSLHDGGALLTSINWQWMEDPPKEFAHRMGNPMPYRPWQYECADGKWLHRMQTAKGNIQVIFKLLGHELPPMRNMSVLAPEERRKLEQVEIEGFKKRPREEWVKLLREHDVPVEYVQPTEDCFKREQAWANGAVAKVPHPEYGDVVQLGQIFRMSGTPGAIKAVHPKPGQHTDEVLKAAGGKTPKTLHRALKPLSLRYPLDGITIIDFGHYLAGPFGPMLMSDLGANVIKVELLEGEAMRSPSQPFMGCQRGKRDIAVDLKTPEGREIAYKLIRGADMAHHNHRPGVAERLKIDYPTLKKLKPDLVYVHSPAYGVTGPDADMGGYDQLFQAMSGLEYMGGGEGNPPIWYKVAAVDHGGAMCSTIGAILALYHRDRTGEGQFVDSALLNASLLYNSDAFVPERGNPRRRPTLDRTQTGLSGSYRLFETREGWICVAALFEEEWRRFCDAVGRADLARDPKYRTHFGRVDHRYELAPMLEPVLKTKTAQEWQGVFDAAGVPAEVCREGYWLEFLKDPENLKAGRVVEYYQGNLGGNLRQFGKIIRFSETPQVIQGPPPLIGEHTRQVLTGLGYTPQQQDDLKARKVVTWPGA